MMHSLQTLISSPQWLWLGIAVILIILDVSLSTSFFLLWLGLVALIVGIIVWIMPTMNGSYQVLIFAIGALSSIVAWRYYLKKHPVSTDRPMLNRRSEQYVGRTFTLSEPIVNGRGKIRVDDSLWQVEGPDLPIGTVVRVVGTSGTILKVKSESN